MSVLIKGMTMPESCYDCDMMELSGVVRCEHAYATDNSTWGRALNCTLIELPDHGDLIDRDALKEPKGCYTPIKWSYEYGASIRLEDINKAHVVIPAERSGG